MQRVTEHNTRIVRRLQAAVIAAALFTLPSALSAEAKNLITEARIILLLRKYGVVGMSYAVVKDADVVSWGTYGYADRERGLRTDKETLFRIASISKPITGTALFQLVDQGKINIDADISLYLGFRLRNPRYPGIPITLRHILTHTSGIEDTEEYSKNDCRYRCDDFLTAVRRQNPPAIETIFLPGGKYYSPLLWGRFPPGKNFRYSNLASGLTATVIERVSRERFDRYVKKNIFDQLGMAAAFNTNDIPDVNKVAVQYRWLQTLSEFEPAVDDYRGLSPLPIDYSWMKPGYNGLIFAPQGGARSTAFSLATFLIAHMNDGMVRGKRLLSAKSAAEMHKSQWKGKDASGFYESYGLNFQLTGALMPGTTLVGHKGIAYGGLSDMYYDPEEHIGVVTVMNGGRYKLEVGGHFDIEKELFPLLYGIGLDAKKTSSTAGSPLPD